MSLAPLTDRAAARSGARRRPASSASATEGDPSAGAEMAARHGNGCGHYSGQVAARTASDAGTAVASVTLPPADLVYRGAV